MVAISWDKPLERFFESGVDHGVLYPSLGEGVAWNGLTSVNEVSRGGEVTGYYLDGQRYFQKANPTEYGATLSAIMYPDEFMESDGIYSNGQGLMVDSQKRTEFGLSYRTLLGNASRGVRYGYKLHLIYNAMAQPTARSYTSIGQNETLTPFSWELFTRPLAMSGLQASAHIVVDSTKAPAEVMVPLEERLYGSPFTAPRLPSPGEILELFASVTSPTLTVTLLDEGKFTASGSNQTVKMIDDGKFQINSPSVVFHDDGTYSISDY